MNAKKVVKTKYPHAYHERFYKTNGEGYTLVWSSHDRVTSKRLAEGKTTAQAWANAAVNIRLR